MQEFLHGAGVVCIYFAVAASAALLARKLIKIPDEIFRKTLHFIFRFHHRCRLSCLVRYANHLGSGKKIPYQN